MKKVLIATVLLMPLASGAQVITESTEGTTTTVVETGDVLLVEKVARTEDLPSPNTGLKMAQVESRFGSPITKVAAVGTPPISRWVYDSFTVYFEGSTVIHSVIKS